MNILRLLLIFVGLVFAWQVIIWLTGVPDYILPSPAGVATALIENLNHLWPHVLTTVGEILAGLILGALLGSASALLMVAFGPVRRWLLPVLVVSQAIPVFALAPLLILWLGYGAGSKVAMAILIIFFPVTATFYDGLRNTEPEWLELARLMGGTPLSILRHIRIPAAMPAFASGMRVAAAVAPIGAVVGEWVGSSSGLGFYMLHSNARMQTDLMFAALVLLAIIALALYFFVDRLMSRLVFWQLKHREENLS
jgi:putative hydroxymethylpyrimidine transport system permease protein